MLAFIDESGHPLSDYPRNRPVVTAVCFDERDAGAITRLVRDMKRDLLGNAHGEVKGRQLLSRSTYRRKSDARTFADDFFAALQYLPITVFAMIMEGPFERWMNRDGRLENRFRFLLQRIELLAVEYDAPANVLFDGHSYQLGGLGERFFTYLFHSDEGRANVHIADAPAFVDSASSVGIQIADMCAYVARVYHESAPSAEWPPQDAEYLSAIRRWYHIIEQHTKDFATDAGEPIPGFYFMAPGEY